MTFKFMSVQVIMQATYGTQQITMAAISTTRKNGEAQADRCKLFMNWMKVLYASILEDRSVGADRAAALRGRVTLGNDDCRGKMVKLDIPG